MHLRGTSNSFKPRSWDNTRTMAAQSVWFCPYLELSYLRINVRKEGNVGSKRRENLKEGLILSKMMASRLFSCFISQHIDAPPYTQLEWFVFVYSSY